MPPWDASLLIILAFPSIGGRPTGSRRHQQTHSTVPQELLAPMLSAARAVRHHPFGVRPGLAGVGPPATRLHAHGSCGPRGLGDRTSPLTGDGRDPVG